MPREEWLEMILGYLLAMAVFYVQSIPVCIIFVSAFTWRAFQRLNEKLQDRGLRI